MKMAYLVIRYFHRILVPHVLGISICLSSLSLKSLTPHTVLNFVLFGALFKFISLMLAD